MINNKRVCSKIRSTNNTLSSDKRKEPAFSVCSPQRHTGTSHPCIFANRILIAFFFCLPDVRSILRSSPWGFLSASRTWWRLYSIQKSLLENFDSFLFNGINDDNKKFSVGTKKRYSFIAFLILYNSMRYY